MRPMILPFSTPFGKYFYEAQRNEIVKINTNLYDFLQLQSNFPNDDELLPENQQTLDEYNQLVEYGYLSESHINTIEHQQVNTIEQMLDRKLNMITLQLTQRCNLRCSYCIYSENSSYNRKHSNISMDFDTAKRAIDFYKRHTIDSDKIAIAFYGGEPLLELNLIKKITQYANKVFKGKKILFRMTTNATLFNDEAIDFFFNSENDFLVLISLDGPSSIQNINRKFPSGKGSFEIVMNNIRNISLKVKNFQNKIHVNTVIDPKNDYHEIAQILNDPLLKDVSFQFNLVEHDGIPVDYEENYLTEFGYDMFLGYISYFRDNGKNFPNKMIEYNFSYIDDTVSKFRTNVLGENAAPGGPCEPGRMRLFVDCFGNFFPCERVSETSSCMKIGSLDEGFYIDNIKNMLNIAQLTKEECKNCWAFSLCTVCVKKADDSEKFSKEIKLKACKAAKRNALDKINQKILTFENSSHEKEWIMKGGINK
ncbi:MAG: radical SAM protein [Clostridium paraputrificum]